MIEHITRLYLHPSRVVCILLTFSLSGYSKLLAQRVTSPFAETYELKTGRNAQGLLSSDINGDKLTDLITYAGKNLYIHYQQRGPAKWRTVTIRLDQSVTMAVAGRCNNDRFGDIVLLTDEPRRIQVLLGRPKDKMVLAWRKWIGEPVKQMLVEDVNSDGDPDLLMYGEKLLGVRVMEGNGNGTFQSAEVLFDEYPFNSIGVGDVNDDGMNDIIASHWVMNQLLIYSGYGRMRFSDPVVVPLDYEPSFVNVTDLAGNKQKSILIASAEPSALHVISGDGLGSYRQTESISLTGRPSHVLLAAINADSLTDIAVLSRDERSLTTIMNDASGFSSQKLKYSGGKNPIGFAFVSHDTTSSLDAAILDGESRRVRVYVNSDIKQSYQKKNTNYLTGLHPEGILSVDLNDDLHNDVIVANYGSESVSIFQNLGAGIFAGQVPVTTVTRPQHVLMLSRKDSLSAFFIADIPEKKYSLLELRTREYSAQSVHLPFRNEINVISASVDPVTNRKIFYGTEEDPDLRQLSLIEIQQSNSKRLTETIYLPAMSDSVTTLTVGNISGSTSKSIHYLQFNTGQKTQDVYRATEIKHGQFSQAGLLHSIAVRENTTALMWHRDVNGDLIDDIIVNFGEPANTLRFFLTRSDTSLSESKTRIGSISVDIKEDLMVTDANGDGIEDVVVKNKLQKSIQLYTGRGDGSFLPRIRLISTEGIGGFTISDIDNDEVPELLYTDSINGLFKILSFNDEAK